MADAEEAVAEANKSVERHRQEVRDVEEEHYAPFREETGIKDLRAYDEAIGKAREDFVKQRTDIREHLAKVSCWGDFLLVATVRIVCSHITCSVQSICS